MSRCAWAASLVLTACLAAGCRSVPPPPPMRAMTRQEWIAPVAFPCRTEQQAELPDTYTEAAARGLDWLMQNRPSMRTSPYSVALSAIAFCAAARDPRMQDDERFRAFWFEEIDYICSKQNARGELSRARPTIMPYEHAWGTRALCEALAWTDPPPADWLDTAQQAIRHILNHQQSAGGWHYGYAMGRQRSTPLTVVQMDALFAAQRSGMVAAGIDVALQRAADDLQSMQDLRSGQFGYLMRGVGTATMDAYALYGLQLAGRWQSLAYRRGWQARMEANPSWPETLQHPLFAAYYAHKATFWQGGLPWRQWQGHFHQELLSGQRESGDWPAPRAEAAFGRAYATALASLMLGTRRERPVAAATDLPAPIPGPVYEVRGGLGRVFVLPSTFIEAFDGILLDPVLTQQLQAADTVWVEGSPREWMHHWTELAGHTAAVPGPRRTREQISFLTDWFGVPRTVPTRIWDEVPAWALAMAILGRSLEQSDRLPESTVESAIARRLRPGLRMGAAVPPTLYGNTLKALPVAEQEILLNHAIHIAPHFATWADEAADAWVRADEQELQEAHQKMLGSDPSVSAVVDAVTAPARARFLLHILQALESNETTWFVIPVWHWLGPQRIREELQRQGYDITTINKEETLKNIHPLTDGNFTRLH